MLRAWLLKLQSDVSPIFLKHGTDVGVVVQNVMGRDTKAKKVSEEAFEASWGAFVSGQVINNVDQAVMFGLLALAASSFINPKDIPPSVLALFGSVKGMEIVANEDDHVGTYLASQNVYGTQHGMADTLSNYVQGAKFGNTPGAPGRANTDPNAALQNAFDRNPEMPPLWGEQEQDLEVTHADIQRNAAARRREQGSGSGSGSGAAGQGGGRVQSKKKRKRPHISKVKKVKKVHF